MSIVEFESALREAIERDLPGVPLKVERQRAILLRATITISEETFANIYFNALTGKTSFALVHRSERVMGYDNYRFWHYHPLGKVQEHIPCSPPTVGEAISKIAEAAEKIK